MSYQIYTPEQGACRCTLGEPSRGSSQFEVRMLSAGGALLDASSRLRPGEHVRATVNVPGGPALQLAGVVVKLEDGSPLVQWAYEDASESQRVDIILKAHMGGPSAAIARAADGQAVPKRPEGRPGMKPVAIPAGPPASGPTPVGASTAPAGDLVFSGKRIDLRASLRSKARTVRASDLASRMQTVQVFDIQTIKELIKEAVAEAVAYLGPALGEAERQKLLEAAEASFREKARLYEAEKAGLEKRTRLLQDEIRRTQAALEEERAKVVSSWQFTVSNTGMIELEQRLGRILDHALHTGNAGKELEDELRQVVARLLDDERDKIRDQAQKAQSDKIALLEKKVERLATTLEVAEKERDHAQRRAQVLEASGGVPLANVWKVGLDDDDPQKEKKLLLLKELFEFNQAVRKELSEHGLLPTGRRVAPSPPPAPAPAPQGAGRDEPPAASEVATPESGQSASAAGEPPARETPPPGSGNEGGEGSPAGLGDAGSSDGDEPDPVDPDDQPWEAPEDFAETASRWSTVRNVGR